MTAIPLLEIKNLHVSFSLYGQMLRAVRGISFDLHAGEALGIVGESGCGKSAAVQAITRLSSSPNIEGSVIFEGEELLQKSEKELQAIRGKRIGMVFQDPMSALNPTMTIGAQIEEALVQHKIVKKGSLNARAHILELLHQVEMPQAEAKLKQYPHQLSGGMRQRVLIAIALSCRPRLLIADEPTTALDATVQAQILELLRKRDPATSLILITHDLGVVAETCDRLLVFYAGKIVEQGNVRELLQHPRHPYTQMLIRSLPHLENSKLLQTIEGAPPNLLDPPRGCAFAERCPFAAPICQTDPPFFGAAACWRA